MYIVRDIQENREFLGVFKNILEVITGQVQKKHCGHGHEPILEAVHHLNDPGPSAQRHVTYRVRGEYFAKLPVRKLHSTRRCAEIGDDDHPDVRGAHGG